AAMVGLQERDEGPGGGVWSEGPGARARQRRAGKAHTRGSVAAKGRPQLWAKQWHAVTDYGQRYTSSVPGGCAWASAALYKCVLYRKRQDYNRQNLSRMVLAHSGYFMFVASSAEEKPHTIL